MHPTIPAHEFPITSNGATLPQDNGYLFLSALSVKFPFLHGNTNVQIAPIRGARTENHRMQMDAHSILHIRGLSNDQALSMSNAWMVVQGAFLGLGEASSKTIRPSPHLVSRLVILPEAVTKDDFLQGFKKRLPLGVSVELGRKRSIRLKGRSMIGYGVYLSGLDCDVSMTIQQQGLGKYTSMGCGVFYAGAPAFGVA